MLILGTNPIISENMPTIHHTQCHVQQQQTENLHPRLQYHPLIVCNLKLFMLSVFFIFLCLVSAHTIKYKGGRNLFVPWPSFYVEASYAILSLISHLLTE